MDISFSAIKSKLPELLTVALISILRRDAMFNLGQWCVCWIELDEFYQVASFSCFGPVHERIPTAFTKKNRVFALNQHFRSGSNNRNTLKWCVFDRAHRDPSWSAMIFFGPAPGRIPTRNTRIQLQDILRQYTTHWTITARISKV